MQVEGGSGLELDRFRARGRLGQLRVREAAITRETTTPGLDRDRNLVGAGTQHRAEREDETGLEQKLKEKAIAAWLDDPAALAL